MASEVKNIFAAAPLVAGSLRVAPLGTAMPADARVDPAPDYVDLGYIGADGFTETLERRTDRKRAFGGKVVKMLQTEYNTRIQCVLLESLRADVLKAVYGASNVTISPASSTHGTQVLVTKNAVKLPHMTWLIDTTDEELTAYYRSWLPDANVIETGDVRIVHTDTIEYRITIEAYPDAAGNHIYTMTDDGQVSGS